MTNAATIARPTDAEAGAYALSLFKGQEPLIWDVGPSCEGAECVDVIIHAKDIGDDGFATVTVWYEADGSLYGEW